MPAETSVQSKDLLVDLFQNLFLVHDQDLMVKAEKNWKNLKNQRNGPPANHLQEVLVKVAAVHQSIQEKIVDLHKKVQNMMSMKTTTKITSRLTRKTEEAGAPVLTRVLVAV